MATPELKLVHGRPARAADASGRARSLSVAAILAALALVATLIDVNPARRPLPAREIAGQAVQQALERGNEDPEVRAALATMRRALGQRPLDSRTRAVYASLLLGLSRSVADTRAAAGHAGRAAALSPVTVPIVRLAVLVLARTGDTDEALGRIHEMFLYDPDAAARLLAAVEPLIHEGDLPQAIPDLPDAWLAWSRQLRLSGAPGAADDWARRAIRRWPGHLPTLQRVAAIAVQRDEWEALAELFPAALSLADVPAAAPALMYRARLKARRGDREGAREDIERGLRLDGDSVLVQVLAGEALGALGADDEARRRWNRVLFTLSPERVDTRRNVLVRLARLEDEHGQPATALRTWRSVLEIAPDHAEATRRVRELSGREPLSP